MTSATIDLAKPVTEALIKLMGLPGLADYLHFVKSRVVGGDAISVQTTADEWRRANDHYHTLETSEAGLADQIESLPLPKSLDSRRRALRAHPWFKESYDELPTTLRMVELRHLMVSQHSVGTDFSHQNGTGLGPSPTAEALFDFCFPIHRAHAPVSVKRIDSDHFVFTSASTDFRFHNTVLARPDQLLRLKSFGPITGALVLPVGYGANLLSAVQSEKRIVLQNGYHRAFALMSLGITHAPMIVQNVTRTDELHLVASEEVIESAAFYFRAKRPPLLKDFLDPAVAKLFQIHRLETQVEIEVKVRTATGTIPRNI